MFLFARRAVPVEEQELGAQQTTAFRARGHGGAGVGHRAEIGQDPDAPAVGHAAGLVGGAPGGLAAQAPGFDGMLGRLQSERIGSGVERAGVGVEDQAGPIGDVQHRGAHGDQRGDVHRRRQDRDMRGRPAARGADAGQPARVEPDQLGGKQVLCQQDGALG